MNDEFLIPEWRIVAGAVPGEDFCIKYAPSSDIGTYNVPQECIVTSSKDINIDYGGLYRIVQVKHTIDKDSPGMELILRYNGERDKQEWELCDSPEQWASVKLVGNRRFSKETKPYTCAYNLPPKEVWKEYVDFLTSPDNHIVPTAVTIHNALSAVDGFNWDEAYRSHLMVSLDLQKTHKAGVENRISSLEERLKKAAVCS